MVNACTFLETKYYGLDAYELTNGHIQVCVVPELGGKITSIQHLSTQREWLWSNPYLPAQPVTYGASFIELYDTGGLDECFPAVSGGVYPDAPWNGVIIPDHGEMWCQPWKVKVVESSAIQIILSMVCYGVRLPYRFKRTLTLAADRSALTLEYQVSNLTIFDMPFVWSVHPILNIEEGMRVSLPAGVENVRVDGAKNDFLGESGSRLQWPQGETADLQPIDLSLVPAKEFGQAYKLYTLPLKGHGQVETAIHDLAGEHSFAFRFRPDEITHVGLWMNYGGWSGGNSKPYFNLGLEPCIGGTDALPDAIKLGEYAVLPAKQTRKWKLELLVN
jgi:galactose mutarotase-like enzyme